MGFGKIRKTAQLAKQIANTQKAIKNCPICSAHQEAIKKHVMEGHPHSV